MSLLILFFTHPNKFIYIKKLYELSPQSLIRLKNQQYFLKKEMQTHVNSFVIRTIQPNKNNAIQNIRQIISINPSIVQFTNFSSERINVVKMQIKNESNFNKRITIKQPSKPYFEINLKQKQLAGKQSTEIHIFFNPQKEKIYIQDQFSIKIDGQSSELFIPIICQYKSTKKIEASTKQLIVINKQNEQNGTKTKISRCDFVRKTTSNIRKRAVSIQSNNHQWTNYKDQIIKAFMYKFEKISRYILQKKVKNEVYLGQCKINNKQKKEIQQYKLKILQINRHNLEQQIKSRFVIQYNETGPILQILNGLNLTWNINSNNSSLILNNALNKLQQQIRKSTISLRFQNIKKSLQIYNNYKSTCQNQYKQLKISQYIQYYNNKINKNKDNNNNITLNNIQLQFNINCLKKQQILIDYQNIPRNQYFRQRGMVLQINQRIGFDNWMPMNAIKENNQEIYMYSIKQLSNYEIFMPINTKNNLKGASMELPFKNTITIEHNMSQLYSCGSHLSTQPATIPYSDYKPLRQQYFCFSDTSNHDNLINNDDNLQQWLSTYINHL